MLISMQVACGCCETPQPMKQDAICHGEDEGGLYQKVTDILGIVCRCSNVIGINLNLLEEE